MVGSDDTKFTSPGLDLEAYQPWADVRLGRRIRIYIFSGCVVVSALVFIWPGGAATLPISSGVGVSITIEQTTTPPPPGGGGGGGGGGAISSTTNFVMKGKAYPAAVITVLRNGAVAKTLLADQGGLFEATLSGLPTGIQTFGVYAEDTNRRRSVTLGFTINILAGMTTTMEGILIPATIDISSPTVNQGQFLVVAGQSFPESSVNLFVRSAEIVKRTAAAPTGQWRYELDTTPIDLGDHTVRAKTQTTSGEQSEFSEVKSFRVLARGARGTPGSCPADLNADNRVDITDLSILLYNWGVPKNTAADYNKDERVDIIDFSILLYYWGTCI